MRAILILDDTDNSKLSRIFVENDISFDLEPTSDDLNSCASELDGGEWEASWESSASGC